MLKTTRTLYMTGLCLILLDIPSLAQTDEDARHLEYVTHVERGLMQLFHGDHRGAIPEFEKALEIEPHHYEIHHYLGLAYADISFPNKAVAAYHRSLELVPDNVEALFSLGRAYFVLGEWAKVVETLQQVIARSPMYAHAYNFLGRAQVKLLQFAAATETLKKAIELNSDAPELYYELGNAYLNQKKYKEAISYFEKAIELDPRYPQPHHGLGTAYLRLGEKEKGRAIMRRFQQLDSEFAQYHIFSRLTYTNPDSIDGWAGLGTLFMRQKNYAEAIPVFRKCIQLEPENTSFYHQLSRALINLGQPEPARDVVLSAIGLNPKEPASYNILGITYWLQDDIPNAIRSLLKAIEFAPDAPHLHLNLAKLYNRIGEDELAEEHYQLYQHFLK